MTVLPPMFIYNVACLALCGYGTGQTNAAAPQAEYSAEELRSIIGSAQARIRSFMVEYESDDYADKEAREIGAIAHRIVAAKAPHSFLHVSSHSYRNVKWQDDFEMQRAILDATSVTNVYDVNRVYFQYEYPGSGPLTGSLPTEFFFYATGIFPLTDRPAPTLESGGAVVLRDVAKGEAFNSVRPRLENVDGRWCHVLECDRRDALWIDVNHNCALVARELYDVDSGKRRWRCECLGHREVCTGVWMPTIMRNIQYRHVDADAAAREEITMDATISVVASTVNDVDDSMFAFKPPPGALRLGTDDAKERQESGGGTDHIDDLVRWTRRVLSERYEPLRPKADAWRECSSAVLGACVAALAALICRRRPSA